MSFFKYMSLIVKSIFLEKQLDKMLESDYKDMEENSIVYKFGGNVYRKSVKDFAENISGLSDLIGKLTTLVTLIGASIVIIIPMALWLKIVIVIILAVGFNALSKWIEGVFINKELDES